MMRLLRLPSLFVSFFFCPFPVFAQPGGGYDGRFWGPGGMHGWGMGWFGILFMAFFWIALIVGLVLLIKWVVQSKRSMDGAPGHGSRAMDILRERYAQGEIDKKEFEEKKRDLS
jgi:putative membrane protein